MGQPVTGLLLASLTLILVISSSIPGCHGDDQPASQLLLFQHLPENHVMPGPHQLVIRTNFEGSVEFIEADSFRIEVNATAANTDSLALLQHNYSSYQGKVQLQLFEGAPPEVDTTAISYILITLGGATGLAFIFSVIFICWWNAAKRPNLPDTKFTNPDSSQAPLLLEGRSQSAGGATGQPGKLKKRRKHGSAQQTSEEYISSEDDQLDGQSRGSPHPTQGHRPSPKKQYPGGGVPVEGMTMDGDNKPVVQYINMQGKSEAYLRGNAPNTQYVPLSDQTTLKVRGNGDGRDHDMPDVVKRGGDPCGGYRGNGRYVPLATSDNSGDYATVGKISSAHIAHILRDPNKGSPKHSHNTDKPPVTFSMPHDDQAELESVSSSKSGESGIRTQGSCDSDRTRTPVTDSDSARSSTGARSKEFARHDPRYYLHGPRPPRDGASPPSSTDLSSEGSSPRLVDEAYGTMGSSSNSTIRSAGTASTGSGSSGSVVTVISAADDPNSLYSRRRMYPRPPPPPEVAPKPQTTQQGGSLARNQRGQPPRSGPAGGNRTGSHYLNTSIVCCLALVCVTGGVYARRVRDTEVHIKVYAPAGFLKAEPMIFVKKGLDLEVKSHDGLSPRKYKVQNAALLDPSDDKCKNHACSQACDSSTGQCVCHEGYGLKLGFKCIDINECALTQYPCHQDADCINSDGGFECRCKRGYYGDEHDCRACEMPCKNGTWEKMPCDETHTKVCLECSKSCMKGYYISAPCTEKRDTVCSICREECKENEYEFTSCHGHQNRLCRDIEALPRPKMSSNLIFEDRRKVGNVMSLDLFQNEITGPLTHMVTLNRGSGFSVYITLKESNLAPLFQAVDHSASNDNAGFYGNQQITEEFCPYPIPENYQLSMVLHEGMTTKAEYYRCGRKSLDSVDRCQMETGYYLSPHEGCETYSMFGRLPTLHKDGWHVLCTRPGKLTDIFDISSDLHKLTTMFVDKTTKCAERRINCDGCTLACARKMQEYQGSHRCNITAEDSDNGESPRLQYCYSCCSKEDCSKVCEVYHDEACKQMRCVTGNLAEFVLTPKFSQIDSIFGCHIEPVPDYMIYDIEFTVLKGGKKILDSKYLKAQKFFDGHHPSKDTQMHNFLKVTYGSAIYTVPNLVEGDISKMEKSFGVGYYQTKGDKLLDSSIDQRVVLVRPTTPFGVSTKTWKNEACDTEKLSELIVPSTASASDSDPYRREPQLTVKHIGPGRYQIFNNTDTYEPYIRFEIPREQSLLKAMYEDTSILDDDTLGARLERQPERWALMLEGHVSVCPGYFYVKIYDPAYPLEPLYEYDVGLNCPKNFRLDFFIPTEGPDDAERTLNVELKDSFRTIKLKVFRPPPIIDEKVKDAAVKYENSGEVKVTIFTPFIAVLCVITSFLALLLIVGFLTEPGRKMPKTDNKVNSQHLLFMVCFVTFRTGYSILVTFTVLLLLIHYVNRDSLNTLTQFSRYSDSAVNSQQVEIDKIQQFALSELDRQNALANKTKLHCEEKLHKLQDLLEESKQQMKVQSTEERLVSQVALQYTKLLVSNLSANVEKFKEEFSEFARSSLDRLTRSIAHTSSALDDNKWLAGAKAIHLVVLGKRGVKNTKPFLEWVGLEQQLESLNADLSLTGFPMPNIEDIINITRPQTNYSQQTSMPKISDIHLPRNQWYYHYESKPSLNVATQPQRAPKVKVKGSDIISWTTLLGILVVVDLIWFVHRMARTYSTAKMILYGCPAYIDCKRPDGRKPKTFSASSKCFHFLKDLNLRVMKTEFVPKVVATVTVCCCIYLILGVSERLLTVKTLGSVGYFQSMVAPVETSHRLARTRIKTNAYRINKFEYPFYEELVNVRTKRYQLMLDMYADLQQSNSLLHDSEYCAWKKLLEPGEPCNCTKAHSTQISFEGCDLPPVTPKPYLRKDFGTYREQLTSSIVPYINSARQVVMDTCHMVVVFVGILVLVDTLGAVTWIYLKRFNMLRLKPMFEIEQFPVPQANHVHT